MGTTDFDPGLGISDLICSANWDSYILPNPAKDILFFEGIETGSIIKIYDVSGRLQAQNKTTSDKIVISTENLTAGIYLLEISGKSAKEFSKIIINR